MMRRLLQDVMNSEAFKELTADMFPEPPQRSARPPEHRDVETSHMPEPSPPATGPPRPRRERSEPVSPTQSRERPAPMRTTQRRERSGPASLPAMEVTPREPGLAPRRPRMGTKRVAQHRMHVFRRGGAHELRRAIVVREVLDKPIALRDPRDQIYNPAG